MENSKAKNIFKYVAPTVLSQVCFFLFTIVDGIFVGRGESTEALAAINIVFPFVMLANALFSLINVGGVVISAIKLGEGDTEGANKVFRHSTAMLGIISICLCLAGVLFTNPLCNLLGANATYYKHVHNYLFWYSLFIIPSGFSQLLQFFGRNDNVPVLVGVATVVSTTCNIFLDWLFIFPLQMGTMGAALATGISQCIALTVLLTHFLAKKGAFRFGLPNFEGRTIKDILANGLPACIGQLSPAVMTLCMNQVLITQIGDIAVNAFSVISYIASFTVAIFNGTSDGLQPLFGQACGAKNEKDLKYYFKSGILINFLGSVLITGVMILISRPVCALFGAEGETLDQVVKALPMFAWGFIIQSFNMMIVSFLYSTDRATKATIVSVLRGIVFTVAVIFAVPAIFGGNSVWFTMGIYEAMSLIVAVILLKYKGKQC